MAELTIPILNGEKGMEATDGETVLAEEDSAQTGISSSFLFHTCHGSVGTVHIRPRHTRKEANDRGHGSLRVSYST